MSDILQAWLPGLGPLSAAVFGLATVLTILLVGTAFARQAQGSTELVTEGGLPPALGVALKVTNPWVAGVADSPLRARPGDALALVLSAVGPINRELAFDHSPPAGCVRTAIKISVPYGRDFTRAMSLVLDACRGFDGVLEEPASTVRVAGLADAAIELTAEVWSLTSCSVSFTEDLRRAVADELNGVGFDIRLEDISTI